MNISQQTFNIVLYSMTGLAVVVFIALYFVHPIRDVFQ
jgi:hypothetical protein